MAGEVDPRLFGRATRLTMDLAAHESIAPAPRLFKGPPPRRSPDLSRFRLARTRAQEIGDCVGEAGSATSETTVQTPNPLLPESQPTGLPIAFSPLWVYLVGRAETAKVDASIYSGEGAIVSHALLAVQEHGLIPFDAWPATPENYASYYAIEREFRRSGRLPQPIADAPRFMVIGDVRRIVSRDQYLEYLGAGFSVWDGVAWRGAMQTRAMPDGRQSFDWDGKIVGGHSTETLHYDLDRDELTKGNSWPAWGDSRGCAVTSLKAYMAEFTDRKLASGESEAVVVSEVDGEWTPKANPVDWGDFFAKL